MKGAAFIVIGGAAIICAILIHDSVGVDVRSIALAMVGLMWLITGVLEKN
jgi:hypothetical protein